jgi:SNF2 family DNA or RNA helicase
MPVVISKAAKALLVPSSYEVMAQWPTAPAYGDKAVIPYTLANTLILRHWGYKVPSPITKLYDWGADAPFKIQIDTCVMLTENPRSYVLNDMGTGKTKAALWAWDFLKKEGLANNLLVVAPLSTLHFVWAAEVLRTLPGRTVKVLYGTKKERLKALAEPADIYVVNHDGLKVIKAELEKRPDIDTLVLDELAVYRNNSERSKMMRKFAQSYKTVWGMTGSPIPNEPTDVWGQAKIITPNTVPKYRKACREMLMTQLDQYVWRPKPDAAERAFSMLQPSVRFSLDDVIELPETIYRPIDVELSSQQKATYHKVKNEMVAMVHEKVITAVNAGAAMSKLVQISLGWVYTKAPAFIRLDAAPRIAAMLDLIQASEHKVLVFVPYRHAIEGIVDICGRLKVPFDYCMIHGDTKDRETLFNAFQNSPQYKVMFAHPGVIHHGLTLTSADTVIWTCPIASLDVYEQANARIIRVSQKHKQQILHLQAAPIEKKLYALLARKQKIQDQLLDLLEEATEQRYAT